MSGSTSQVNKDTHHRLRRRRDRGGFRVVPKAERGEELYAVVGPTGVALYTFFHPGLRRGNGQEEDEPPDQGIPSSNGQVRQPSEVVRFPS